MGYQFATIGLGPVLLAQGRYVRRVTPRLPEPAGQRQGIDGAGPALSLLILGDSAAAGVGVTTQSEALSGQLVSALSPYFRISWKLVARTGLTTQEILQQLEAEPGQRFDVAVTSAGVNDVTGGTGRDQWLATQHQLVELLRHKFQTRHILLSSLPPMHGFPALPQPLRWYLGMRAKRLNQGLSNWVEQHQGCEFVSIDFPLSSGLMASDGFHPGAAAYSIWAGQLADVIRRRLKSSNAWSGAVAEDVWPGPMVTE
jgi:lysophospholipase L1-like esterase